MSAVPPCICHETLHRPAAPIVWHEEPPRAALSLGQDMIWVIGTCTLSD